MRLLLLLAAAAIHVACSSKQPPDPSATLHPTVLSRQRVGDVIDDGIGFGGVRLGMTDSELIAVWGETILNHNPEGRYSVRLFRLSTGEHVVVYLSKGKVTLIKFVVSPSGRPLARVPLRTSRGVELGDPLARVEKLYGTAERQNEAYSAYPSQGIAFNGSGERVYHIEIFQTRPADGRPAGF
ncbi:MAG TPA: hypothetical protein VGL14_06740 [Methylomirabilota bacterium]